MNINNSDFYSGSGSMNECYQQRNERLAGIDNLRHFFNAAESNDVERCPISFRSMNEHRSRESNKGLKSRTIQKVDVDSEELKVPPYEYIKPCSNMSLEYPDITVHRPCTDDVLIAPPTVSPISSPVLQNDAEHQSCSERLIEPIFHRNLIEVGNDLIPMSGVDETSRAHKKGHTVDTVCVECSTVLFSLESASMVVCPFCRCVSPIESYSNKKLLPTIEVHAGIGLPIDYVIALE